MGQVPQITDPSFHSQKIGLIGRGRAATHLLYYFKQLGLATENWHRGKSMEELEKLRDCRAIFLAISDSNIEEFVLEHPWLLQKEMAHLSGVTTSAVIRCAHPLVSFGSKLFDLEFYKKIPFVTETERPFLLKNLIPELTNPVFSVERAEKARYHALCVCANNFSTLLWQKFFQVFKENFQIPFQASSSLLESTFLNLKNDYQNALTGPLKRKDEETIQKNIAALEGDQLQDVYKAFVSMYRHQNLENIIYTPMNLEEMGL